jgi:hypothetical protein
MALVLTASELVSVSLEGDCESLPLSPRNWIWLQHSTIDEHSDRVRAMRVLEEPLDTVVHPLGPFEGPRGVDQPFWCPALQSSWNT